jgi:hypothetical protein
LNRLIQSLAPSFPPQRLLMLSITVLNQMVH